MGGSSFRARRGNHEGPALRTRHGAAGLPKTEPAQALRRSLVAAATGALALVLLGAAPASGQIPGDSLTLQGDYIYTGVSHNGTLGVGGSTSPGFIFDSTGTSGWVTIVFFLITFGFLGWVLSRGILFFATTQSTRKFANLSGDPRVSMLVDNRTNNPSDFRWAKAVTVTGKAEKIDKEKEVEITETYLRKHPHLKDFLDSPSCALIRIRVETYYLVTRFQEVMEIHVTL